MRPAQQVSGPRTFLPGCLLAAILQALHHVAKFLVVEVYDILRDTNFLTVWARSIVAVMSLRVVNRVTAIAGVVPFHQVALILELHLAWTLLEALLGATGGHKAARCEVDDAEEKSRDFE